MPVRFMPVQSMIKATGQPPAAGNTRAQTARPSKPTGVGMEVMRPHEPPYSEL